VKHNLRLWALCLWTACGGPPRTGEDRRSPQRLAPAVDAADEAALAWCAADATAFERARAEVAEPNQRGFLEALRAHDALDEAPLTQALTPASAEAANLEGVRHTLRISFLPQLDRPRLLRRPPRLVEGGQIEALGQVWPLSARPPKADVEGLVVSFVPLPPGPAHLEVRRGGRLLGFRDGKVVLASEPDRVTPGTVRFTAPGQGPLFLVWASDEVPRVRRLATEPPPRVPDDAGPYARLVAAHRAIRDQDPDAARTALEPFDGRAPNVERLRAEGMAVDPHLTTSTARDARRAAWLRLVDFAPGRAHLELGRFARQGGDDEAARAHLARAIAAVPGDPEPYVELYRVHFAQGWSEEADAALQAAERLTTAPCELLDERLSLQGARGNAAGRARLVERLVGCDRGREAAELLLELERPEEALARLDALGTAEATDRRLARLRFRALVAQGRLDEARTLAEQAPPTDAEAAVWRLDLGDSSWDGPAVEQLLNAHTGSREAQEFLLAWPELGPFAPLLLDTEAVVAAFEAENARAPLEGPAIQVLDHGATLYFADGRRLRWAHEILAIRSREAAEALGELSLPADARAVSVYTLKADGRRLPAEDMPEKDSLSLPDLGAGDYLVAQYLEPGDNGYLYDTGFLTPRAYFRSTELPVHLQRFDVLAWDGQTPVAQRLSGAPAPTPLTLGPRTGLRFEVRQVAPAPREDDAGPAGLWLPSVRVGREVQFEQDLVYVRDRVSARRVRSDALDDWARETAGVGDDTTRLGRLARGVRERIDGELGLLADSATRMWHAGHGHRALVLSIALDAIGLRHRLLLARPRVHVQAEPFLQIADFPWALLEVEVDGSRVLVDPGPDRAPVGFVPFGFAGGDAVVVWPPEASMAPFSLPAQRAVEDQRRVHLKLFWDRDGRITGEVDDTLVGQESIVIGDYLGRIPSDQRSRVVERLLLPVLGAVRVLTFDDPVGRDSPDGPLRLRATFEARGEGPLALGLFPVSPGRAYAALPTRVSPLEISLPTDQQVVVELESARDLEVNAHDEQRAHGPHAFAVQVTGEKRRWRFTSRVRIAGGLVTPDAYGPFAEFAREVDAHERVVLRPVGPAPRE
jgi:tetratricopeptide (TPR) repeat protein